jgi:hypothetical protein
MYALLECLTIAGLVIFLSTGLFVGIALVLVLGAGVRSVTTKGAGHHDVTGSPMREATYEADL